MLISDSEFTARHGDEFARRLGLSRSYVAAPELLKRELYEHPPERTKVTFGAVEMLAPRPDPFAFQMNLAQGFSHDPRRLKNLIIAENAEKAEVLKYLPTRLDIEPAARCNSRCIMCQVATWPKMKRTDDDLTVPQLVTLLDEQYGLTEVKLHGMGEPLLNKHFFEMVGVLRERHIWVRTNTNCTLLHKDEAYKTLIDCGINEVQMSVDGATREVFELIRAGSPFDRVVENITLANEYANQKDVLVTRMWSTIQQNNVHQLGELYELGKRMGFRRITFSVGLGDWGQQHMRDRNEPMQIKEFLSGERLLAFRERAERDGIDLSFWNLKARYVAGDRAKMCPWPFEWGYVAADLRVVPCAMIGNPDVSDMGEAGAGAFGTTWNGDTYRAFRRDHLEGRIPEPCRNCYIG